MSDSTEQKKDLLTRLRYCMWCAGKGEYLEDGMDEDDYIVKCNRNECAIRQEAANEIERLRRAWQRSEHWHSDMCQCGR